MIILRRFERHCKKIQNLLLLHNSNGNANGTVNGDGDGSGSGSSSSSSSGNKNVSNSNENDDDDDDDDDGTRTPNVRSIDYVPGLINEIMSQTSTSASMSAGAEIGPQKKYTRTTEMTELILSVVLNFTRCFLQNLPPPSASETSLRKESEERVLDWLSDIVSDILFLDPTSTPPPTIGRIPVLDALLATTGSHNGMSHDECLQDIILSSSPYLSSSLVVTNEFPEFSGGLQKSFCSRSMDKNNNDNTLETNVIGNPRYFCERVLQSKKSDDDSNDNNDDNENGNEIGGSGNANSDDSTDGEKLEMLCTENLFLGQMQSFLNTHDNDEPLLSLFNHTNDTSSVCNFFN